MSVAVVIPTRGRRSECARAVRSVEDRVVVVNDFARKGASAARNEGMSLTSSDVVVFMDDDCTAHSGWLSAMRAAVEADPAIGVAFGTVLTQQPGESSFDAGSASKVWGTELFEKSTLPGSARPNRVGLSANMAIRRTAWAEAGGFDERLGAGVSLAGGEEWDLAYRAARAGWKVAHVPVAVVDHHGIKGRDASRLVTGYAAGTGAMLVKHLRCGDVLAARVLVSGAAELAAQTIRRGLAGKRPLGLRSLLATLGGAASGLTIALDRRRRIFQREKTLGLIAAAETFDGPRSDYVVLSQLNAMELCFSGARRSVPRTLMLVLRALRQARRVRAFFADGEQVGLPLAVALSLSRARVPVTMIGHRPVRRTKLAMLKWLSRRQAPIRIAVHSRRQAELLVNHIPALKDVVSIVPYGVDTCFWTPALAAVEADLIVAAGIEHRDYETLARACASLPLRVSVALGSAHSRRSHCAQPRDWPANFSITNLDAIALRDLYAKATLVVVPLLATDFQAGITSLLEAMAMGKPVITTATDGLAEVLAGECVRTVPPSDPAALREAVLRLMSQPRERICLGARARSLVQERYGLNAYVNRLVGVMDTRG